MKRTLALCAVMIIASGCNLFRSGPSSVPHGSTPTSEVETENTAPDTEMSDTTENDTVGTDEEEPMTNEEEPANDETTSADGVTWLGTPKKLTTDLKLFVIPSGENAMTYTIDYCLIGKDGGKGVIAAMVRPDAPGSGVFVRFLQTDGGYELLTQLSDIEYVESMAPPLASTVTVNKTKTYDDIALQDEITVKGVVLTARKPFFAYSNFFADYQKSDSYLNATTVFADTAYGPLYTVTMPVRSGDGNLDPNEKIVTKEAFVLKRPDGTAQTYQLALPFVNDDFVPQITWADGSKNTFSYQVDGLNPGCGTGGAFYPVLNAKDTTGLVKTGTTSSKEPIYEPAADSALMKAGYATLPEGKYYEYDTTTGEGKRVPISLEEYATKHPVLVYKDALGRLVMMLSMKYGIGAECGKPVIYLYPTETTNVSVKVGAAITKSEPAYNKGWDVTAEPDGTITTNDQRSTTYDSLFWEGLGDGAYPAVTEGSVVKQGDIKATLLSQLTQLGLNDKESADFLEFWLPKMPSTPYVRLTWFGTQAMDQLAPLTITPQPDSVLRIFLDFEGVEKPVKLAPQKLDTHFKRNGFTVVEWGGLLVH